MSGAVHAHVAGAVAAGTCPVHGTKLGLADTGDGSTAGICETCGRYWWHDPATDEAGSFWSRPPFDGTPMPRGGTP
jgi:hypothetical protein